MPADRLSSSYWPATPGPELRDLTVGDALREAAADSPDMVALLAPQPGGEPRSWTYAALWDEAQQAARALAARFAPGERLAVWAPNIPEWVVVEYAAALAGLTLVTVNPALTADEVAYVLARSGAHGIFLTEQYRGDRLLDRLATVQAGLPALRSVHPFTEWDDFVAGADRSTVLPAVAPADIAQIQYTSGTTGAPKGAALHHRGIVNNAALCLERLGCRHGSVLLSPMPLFHTAGCVLSVLGALTVRGTLVLPAAFDPELCLGELERERVDTLFGVPTMLMALLGHERFGRTDLGALQRVLTGGAVVPPDLVTRVEHECAARVSVVFAQTEASPAITQVAADDSAGDRRETLGRPLPHTEVRIVDPSGQGVQPVGEVGELCTRGYHVMAGYDGDPAATAAAIDADGWLHTGDLASMDERGYCIIRGRLKDMIIRGGENIYPREIEEVLLKHPGVAAAAVVGVPDEHWGERVAACVVPAEPAAPPAGRDLDAWCRERLAAHKVPRHWSVLPALPLTASGKVKKYELRELVAGGGSR